MVTKGWGDVSEQPTDRVNVNVKAKVHSARMPRSSELLTAVLVNVSNPTRSAAVRFRSVLESANFCLLKTAKRETV